MGKKLYEHPYSEKTSRISIRCTPKQKMRFDEIVSAMHKSKTELILSMVDKEYRRLFLDNK